MFYEYFINKNIKRVKIHYSKLIYLTNICQEIVVSLHHYFKKTLKRDSKHFVDDFEDDFIYLYQSQLICPYFTNKRFI